MASKQTNNPTDVNEMAAGSDAPVTAAAVPDANATDGPSHDLGRTSLKAKAGATRRTKKTAKTKGPRTPKAEKAAAKTKEPTRKAKKAAPQDKKVSALDAAAKVLEEAGQPMNCQEMIAAMAAKGYWSSPAGKTPASTLYSALLREIKTKASQARFQKAARGQFAYQTPKA